MYQNVILVETDNKLERKSNRNTKGGPSIQINLSFKPGAAFINEENVYQGKYFSVIQI